MAAATEPSVYTGTAGLVKNTTLLTHTLEDYMPRFSEAIFTQTPALKVLTLNGLGKNFVIGGGDYGNITSTNNKGLFLTDPSFQFSGPIMTTSVAGTHVGRMGNINPSYNDPGNGWAYAYVRGVWSIYIPEEFIKDNKGKNRLLNRLETEMKIIKMQAVQDVNYTFLGHSSAPASGPSFGLTKLVSATQSTAVSGDPGGISVDNSSFWQNKYRECATVGGGGSLDRPLVLLRKMGSILLDVRQYTGSSNDQVFLTTRGAYQYYQRAAYADTRAQGVAALQKKDYYDADIEHLVYNGRPVVYDPSVTVPGGATASTECMYVLDLNHIGLAIRKDEFFEVEGWDRPHVKDKQRYYQANIWLRYTPFVSNRRIQGVLYNMPANADAA